jgi:hypothetical protein
MTSGGMTADHLLTPALIVAVDCNDPFRIHRMTSRRSISGTVSNDELVLRLKPADTGTRGWYLGTTWSDRRDSASGGFTIDLPSPTTGELLTIDFVPATAEEYNTAIKNARP